MEGTCGKCRNNSINAPCLIIQDSFLGMAVEWRILPEGEVLCVKFAPKIDQSKAPPADCFRVGDWWQSPKGFRYLIVSRSPGPGRVVAMRAGGRGRLLYRTWDSIKTKAGFWVRESWGGEE